MNSLPYRYESPCGKNGCEELAKWYNGGSLYCRTHFDKRYKHRATKLLIGPTQRLSERTRLEDAWTSACIEADKRRREGSVRGSLLLQPCVSNGHYPLVDGCITLKLGSKRGRLEGRALLDYDALRPSRVGIDIKTLPSHITEYTLGSTTLRRDGMTNAHSIIDGQEEVISGRQWQNIYFRYYEKLLVTNESFRDLTSRLYEEKLSLVLSAGVHTPSVTEEDAVIQLDRLYGTDAFRYEVALFYILYYWREPERLPWYSAQDDEYHD